MTSLVVDRSAVVAVLWQEPTSEAVSEALRSADRRFLATPSLVELGMVLEGHKAGGHPVTERLVRDLSLDVVPFTSDTAARALDAFRRFGKGRHPAGLNLGDCFTYALAEEKGLPILAVGDDFRRTDLPVLPEEA